MNAFNTLQWRIVLAYTSLIVVSMGVLSFYMVNFLSDYHDSNLRDRMTNQTEVLVESVRPYFTDQLDNSELRDITRRVGEIIDARVTIVSTDGTVLDDTGENPSIMDNHSNRPEIQVAINKGVGHSTRYSKTIGKELRYTAVQIEIDEAIVGIARIGIPDSDVTSNVNSIVAQVAVAITVVTIIATLLGYYLARRTSRSLRLITEAARHLASGNLNNAPVEALTSDETQDLADAFNRMADSLKDMIGDLSEERNKLSAILDTMTDGVVVIRRKFYLRTGEGLIELMNPASLSLLNISIEESIGGRFMETIKDHELQDLVHQAADTNEQQYSEIELMHPRRYFGAVATPIFGEGGEGVLLTLHDLTRIRQVDTTRRQFVSNVSHELRSPIASIRAMTETLAGGALDEPVAAREFVGRIHAEIQRMSNIVDELLQLSRLESGEVSLESEPFDLNGLIKEIELEFRTSAQSKNIGITSMLFEALPQVYGEREKIRQVLINLVDNALKFTEKDGSLQLSSTYADGNVRVEVSDTGIGIAEEDQDHIFERFYRVDSSRKFPGTGLGLSIAKHIVQAHGGDIAVSSTQGEGCRFHFSIPIPDKFK